MIFVFFIFSLLLLIVNFWLLLFFDRTYGSYQFVSLFFFGSNKTFFSTIGFGLDGISLTFLLLTSLLISLSLITAWKSNINFIFEYVFLVFTLLVFLLLSFTVLDVFSFFCLFECTLLPMFLIVGIWGTISRKIYASMLFIIFTVWGSIFLFFSVLLLYYEFGTFSFSLLSKVNLVFNKQVILGFFCFISFAVKIPIIPFHIWLPEAHVEAPSVGSVILAGILLKLGTYGVLRIVIPFFREAVYYLLPIIFMLGVLSIIYPALITLRQNDLKRIVAYSSISHMNLIVLGLFSNSFEGISGGYFLMIAHGLVSGLYFFLIGFLYDRYGSRLLLYYGGLVKIMPLFCFFFFIASICNIGLPCSCNFIGEFLIFMGLVSLNKFIYFLSIVTILLSAIYTIYLFNRICFGNLKDYIKIYEDITYLEIIIILPICILVFLLGLFPFFILDTSAATLYLIIEKFKY